MHITFLQSTVPILDQNGVGHSRSSAVQHAESEALRTVHVEHSALGGNYARDICRVHMYSKNLYYVQKGICTYIDFVQRTEFITFLYGSTFVLYISVHLTLIVQSNYFTTYVATTITTSNSSSKTCGAAAARIRIT